MPSKPVLPSVVSFHLCGRVLVDHFSGRHSLVDLYVHLRATRFPAIAPRLVVWTELRGGHGSYEATIEIAAKTGDRPPVFRISAPDRWTINDPLTTSVQWARLPDGLVFQLPGVYVVRLELNGDVVAERDILVAPPEALPRPA